MIIIDFNPFGIAAAFSLYKEMPNEFSPNLIRHAIFSQIKTHKLKLQAQFGKEIVIATEGYNNWRKEVFPYYKIKRKEQRNSLPIPWEDVMAVIEKTKKDIEEYFPWKVVCHPRAEADDVVAAIAKEMTRSKKEVCIVSSDKDFAQLQIYPNIKQFSPYHENFLIDQDPHENRLRKIISGDSGDSVPNIISDADVFTIKDKRQKPMTAPRMTALLESIPDEYKEAYDRNKKLVDLIEGIPKEIETEIVELYNNAKVVSGKMYNYFAANGMNHHLENLQDFT